MIFRPENSHEINRSHPALDGLAALYDFSGRKATIRDNVGINNGPYCGGPLTLNASLPTFVTRPWGTGVYNADGTNYYEVDSNGSTDFWNTAQTEFTVLTLLTIEDVTSSGPFYAWKTGGGTHGFALMFKTTPDTFSFLTRVSGTSSTVDGSLVFTADKHKAIPVVCRYRNGAKSLWVNGHEDGTGSHSTSIPATTATSQLKVLYSDQAYGGGSVVGWYGAMGQLIFLHKAISDAAIRQWSADPWGWVMPRPRQRVGKAPAAGGATIPIFDHHYRGMRV